ncbi:MAG: helix-turn-helix transcriptional regulator [Paludibacteraceae bacterium]
MIRATKINKKKSGKLLYIDEHTTCKHYIKEYNSGFWEKKIKRNAKFTLRLKKQFAIIFLSAGELEITSELGETKIIGSEQQCLLDYEQDYVCSLNRTSFFTILFFEHPKILCDKFSLLELNNYKKKSDDDIRILPMNSVLKQFIEHLGAYLRSKMMCQHLHDIKESEWLFILRGFYTKEQIAYFLSPIIDSLDDFVVIVKDNHLACNSVKELAEKCNMSEKTFTRRFREHFNDTPKQWMMREKAKLIKSDIEHTDMNIKQISNKYGFNSPTHLNIYYKKQYNHPPGQERKY